MKVLVNFRKVLFSALLTLLVFTLTSHMRKARKNLLDASILEELQILLAPERALVSFFLRFQLWNSEMVKALRNTWWELLPKIDNAGGFEPCAKGTCQLYNNVITTNTFKTKACGEVFIIQSGPLNCNWQKVLYLSIIIAFITTHALMIDGGRG